LFGFVEPAAGSSGYVFLRKGMRMTPADLERLNRLSVALIEEAITPQLAASDVAEPAPERTIEHARTVLDALAEAGALEALGLTRIPTEPDEQTPDEGGTDDEQQ
jgi:hypothetical protein